MATTLETEALTRRFWKRTAVRDLSLQVGEGVVYALLGPNGAGKSTATKVLLNLLRPSSGRARVLGVDSTRLSSRHFQRIGYVSPDQQPPDWMTVEDLCRFCGLMYPTWDDELAARLLRMFDLPPKHRLRHLSRGMKTKAAMLSSLAYRPRLLILDEPFSGLDPVVRDDLIEGMLELCQQESWTVFLCSQEIEEVERLCDQVGFLKEGRLVFSESLEAIQSRFREVELVLDVGVEANAPLPEHWIQVRREGRVLRFVETRYSPQRTEAETKACFPGASHLSVTRMSLKSVYTALAR